MSGLYNKLLLYIIFSLPCLLLSVYRFYLLQQRGKHLLQRRKDRDGKEILVA